MPGFRNYCPQRCCPGRGLFTTIAFEARHFRAFSCCSLSLPALAEWQDRPGPEHQEIIEWPAATGFAAPNRRQQAGNWAWAEFIHPRGLLVRGH
jgi:hypothetical protein